MKFYIDTGNFEEIKKWSWFIDGITTNPSLLSREKNDSSEIINKICKIVNVPISVEVVSTNAESMINEAIELAGISNNIVIKIPMTCEGIKTVQDLNPRGVKTNVTLIFSPIQALLAAKAGADFASIFVGRLDDLGVRGMDIVKDTKHMYSQFGFDTKIITASIRSLSHIEEAAKIGSDIVTIPPKFLPIIFNHSLTDIGIATFTNDWNKKNGLRK